VSAAGPCDLVRKHADAAQVFGGIGFQDGQILRAQRGCEEDDEQDKRAHAMIVPEVVG